LLVFGLLGTIVLFVLLVLIACDLLAFLLDGKKILAAVVAFHRVEVYASNLSGPD